MARDSRQAMSPPSKGVLNEFPTEPVALLLALDRAFPLRSDPKHTSEERAVIAGQRQVVDYIARQHGVTIKQEYVRHVH